MPHNHIYHEASSDYWKTPAGINERIAMIGEDFTFRVYNNALAFYGSQTYSSLLWIGYPDACKICQPFIGNYYKSGQYIPSLPKHPFCRCTFKLIPK